MAEPKENVYSQFDMDTVQKIDAIDKKLDVLLSEHAACRSEVKDIRKMAEQSEHDIIRIKQFGLVIAAGIGGIGAWAKDLIFPT